MASKISKIKLRAYYYLTKPGIVYGNLMTTAAGFLLAGEHVDISSLAAVLAGTGLVIASACVCNNYIDRDIDARMARTKRRALVTKAVSDHGAMLYATVLGVAGFAALGLWTNLLTTAVGAAAFVIYTIVYGVAKRRTVHGTLVGSLAGAAPPLAGYTAATNQLDGAAGLLFLAMAAWQMAHFYAIAIYRANEYKAAGIPVLPLVRGVRAAKLQISAYIVVFLAAAFQLTTFSYTGYIYLGVMAVAGFWWLWQALEGFNAKDDDRWARRVFGVSLLVLMIFSAALAVGSRLP